MKRYFNSEERMGGGVSENINKLGLQDNNSQIKM